MNSDDLRTKLTHALDLLEEDLQQELPSRRFRIRSSTSNSAWTVFVQQGMIVAALNPQGGMGQRCQSCPSIPGYCETCMGTGWI